MGVNNGRKSSNDGVVVSVDEGRALEIITALVLERRDAPDGKVDAERCLSLLSAGGTNTCGEAESMSELFLGVP